MSPLRSSVVSGTSLPFTLAPAQACPRSVWMPIGEVDRRRAAGQDAHVATRRMHEHLVGEDIGLDRLGGSRPSAPAATRSAGAARTSAPRSGGRGGPARSCTASGRRPHTQPPRASSRCGSAPRTGADRDRRPRCWQRLVERLLGAGDVVVEARGERSPDLVHDAQCGVTVRDRVDEHAQRHQVVDLAEVLAVLLVAALLLQDRVEVLGTAGDLRFDPGPVQGAP